MRTAVIDGNKVVNVIEAEPGFEMPGFLLVETGSAGPGWGYVDGEFVAPEPSTPTVPQSVTMRQARRHLLNIGRLQDVDAAIDALPEPQRTAAKIDWEYSQVVERQSEFVLMLAPVLGWDAAGLDTMFIEADKLSA